MVNVGVADTTVSASQQQTLSGRGAHVYTAHRGWLGVVTGITAASTEGVLVSINNKTMLTAVTFSLKRVKLLLTASNLAFLCICGFISTTHFSCTQLPKIAAYSTK